MTQSVRDLLRFNGTLPDPRDTPGVKNREKAEKQTEQVGLELSDLQERLWANGKAGAKDRALLVLQGMDAAGKDGTVKRVVGAVNPAGCRITSFGKPTKEELAHDFLWRITNALPRAGEIGVFNRSQYEDVLIVRVHDLVPRATWARRYARINAWEKRQAAAGTSIVKVFLHISKDEQKQRLLERIERPDKHWKVGVNDIPERRRWDDYQEAYAAALSKCSTDVAPWYVVPADRKWYRDWAVSHLLAETLRELGQGWPVPEGLNLKGMRRELKAE
jgi:PPK2 family polyphosphate:nucleotide phosphotransferase